MSETLMVYLWEMICPWSPNIPFVLYSYDTRQRENYCIYVEWHNTKRNTTERTKLDFIHAKMGSGKRMRFGEDYDCS